MPEESAPPLLPHQPLDEAYGQKALLRVRKAVEGNGLDPESVALGAVEGMVYAFDAHIYFRFAPKVSEEALPAGRPPPATFQTLASRADIDREVTIYTHKIVEDPTSGAQAAAAILARPDRGFGFRREEIPAAFPPKNYVLKETCPDCKGAGKSACAKCSGTGKVPCPKCKTTKMALCPMCFGRKTAADGKSKCVKCHGHGRIPCLACHQTGYVSCTGCSGKNGKIPCKTCAGTGWTGRKIAVEMSVTADYDYDRAALPDELADLVEKLGPRTTAQGFARLEPGPLRRGEDRSSFILPCRLTSPFARVGILLPEQNFTCTVFGHNGKVSGLPPFLDAIIEPGVKELRRAAASGNIALPHLRRACRLRTVRSAILTAARSSPGQAIETLKRENGTTLSPAMMKNLVALANRALNRIATVPALIGMAVGLAAAAALYGFAFSEAGRGMISANLPGAMAANALDLVIFLIGGFFGVMGASAGANHAFRSVLGKAAQGPGGIRIKRRWATVTGWALSLALFAGLAFAMLDPAAPSAPGWFAAIHALVPR